MAPDPEKDYDPDINEPSDDELQLRLEEFGEGDELYVKHEVNYEERFKAASREIKMKGRFGSEDDVEQFLSQYDDVASKPVAKLEGKGNLLHALVEAVKHTDGLDPEDVELLVRRMVGKWPSLLKDVNRDGHNPVFMAIRDSQHKLVDYMISACTDADCLNGALKEKAQGGHTCLHAALKEKLNPRTTRTLVERASDEVLAVQDDQGRTPMHYAVSFAQCGESRTALIALFIDRDLKALENSARTQQTFLDLRSKLGRSVYREHEYTRAQLVKRYEDLLAGQGQGTEASKQGQAGAARPAAMLAPRDPRDKPRDLLQGGSDNPTFNPRSKGDADDASDAREIERRRRKAEEAKKRSGGLKDSVAEEIRQLDDAGAPLRNVRGGDRDAGIPSAGTDGNGDRLSAPARQVPRTDSAGHDPAPNTPLKRRSTARFDGNPEQERDKDKEKPPARPAPKQRASSSATTRFNELIRNSDAILLKLKLHYMRTRSAEMAISFLYGKNMDGECPSPCGCLNQTFGKHCVVDVGSKISKSALITTGCPARCRGTSSSRNSAQTASPVSSSTGCCSM
jgi:hypothetical protein